MGTPQEKRFHGRTRAGIGDVAALAGVAQGTVSNVLNHPDRVSPATRDKVERAMAMLNYVPNQIARSLAVGVSSSVGLVLSDLSNSLFIDIARGAETAVAASGGSLLLANTNSELEREQRCLQMFAQSRITGVMITLNDASHYAAIAKVAPHTTPVVMLNYRADTNHFCSVSVDNELGGYLAARHLIGIGRRRLAFVGGPDELTPVHDRELGFWRAVKEADVAAEVLRPKSVNRADGWHIGVGLADRSPGDRPDAVFAASDLLAAGILQALASRAVKVPEDVAIVGYDNNQAAWDSPVPITTIAQPGEEMGRLGAEMVAEEVRAENGTAHHAHRAQVLQPQVVARESTTRSH
ncbi:LacI family DNA-binding transcriptional regulator [Nocardioides sp. NPDC006303]|uniref:LacI family DNA-binding transcriptional regulator n=1 Tax=Nocardioides sp. NPDC006303 TaxID=3156747 RepID=UPI0033B7701F